MSQWWDCECGGGIRDVGEWKWAGKLESEEGQEGS